MSLIVREQSLLTERQVGGIHDRRADLEQSQLEFHADRGIFRSVRHGESLFGLQPGWAGEGDAESRHRGEAAHDTASGQPDPTWAT